MEARSDNQNHSNKDHVAASLSERAVARINLIKARYPNPKSAVMSALYIAQEELGVINEGAIHWVSQQLDIPPVHVMEVATFYTMYYKKPVGKYHFQVCRTLSCSLRGAKDITAFLENKFGLSAHEVSADGMWSFEEVECLGSCGSAPLCQINDRYFENLTIDKLDKLLKEIAEEQPDLRLSTVNDQIGDGLKQYSKSEILPGQKV